MGEAWGGPASVLHGVPPSLPSLLTNNKKKRTLLIGVGGPRPTRTPENLCIPFLVVLLLESGTQWSWWDVVVGEDGRCLLLRPSVTAVAAGASPRDGAAADGGLGQVVAVDGDHGVAVAANSDNGVVATVLCIQ